MNIEELLNRISKRPTMYIGERSVHCLKAFLDGFVMGQEDHSESSVFMLEFQRWTEARYRISTTQSWAHIIAFFTSDQPAALDQALKLFAEFRSAR